MYGRFHADHLIHETEHIQLINSLTLTVTVTLSLTFTFKLTYLEREPAELPVDFSECGEILGTATEVGTSRLTRRGRQMGSRERILQKYVVVTPTIWS